MNRVTYSQKALFAACLLLITEGALAYVGPGTGLSAIGSFFAFLMAIILVIVGFFWLPLKRLYKKWRGGAELQDAEDQTEQSVAADDDTDSNSRE